MAKIKYYYDTETCKYERLKVSFWDQFINFLGFLMLSLILAAGMVYSYNRYFESPLEAILRKENEELKLYYSMLENQMKDANEVLASLQQRDDNVYRVIFEAEAIPATVREAGVGGAQRYKDLLESGLSQEELIVNSFMRLDNLKKKMYIQSKSYDEIVRLAKNKDHMWAAIPAIQPVSNKELSKLASGFGMRIDPIYKVMKMHMGCDFACQRGTPIYATGDGKIIKVKTNFWGYGKEVEIDHGYGYVTKYAHMDAFNVKLGQTVKRGECIGFVGNTGKSTAPHLHYEVIKNGKPVNPVNYFYEDIDESEYEKLIEIASVENQSLG